MTLQNENRKLNLVRCSRCREFHATDKGCNVRSVHIAPVVRRFAIEKEEVMAGWGISEKASEKEKIKSYMADFLNGLNSCGIIDYSVYCQIFDYSMDLLDKMYEHGKSQNVT